MLTIHACFEQTPKRKVVGLSYQCQRIGLTLQNEKTVYVGVLTVNVLSWISKCLVESRSKMVQCRLQGNDYISVI